MCSALVAGGRVVMVPLISTIADRRGAIARRKLQIESPVRSCTVRETAKAPELHRFSYHGDPVVKRVPALGPESCHFSGSS